VQDWEFLKSSELTLIVDQSSLRMGNRDDDSVATAGSDSAQTWYWFRTCTWSRILLQ
jgi:hypothetical protein